MEKQKVFIPVEKLIEEIKRVKKQRNNYEQELMIANRRLLKMKVELEIEKEKRLEKQKSFSEDELIEKIKYEIAGKCHNETAAQSASVDCAQIAKQYSDSKLSELEKWVDEQFKHADSWDKQDDTVTRYFSGKKDGLSLIKIKIQFLK